MHTCALVPNYVIMNIIIHVYHPCQALVSVKVAYNKSFQPSQVYMVFTCFSQIIILE